MRKSQFLNIASAACLGILISQITYGQPAENPSSQEIIKKGKAATAFLEFSPFGRCAAFCVDKSGIFITNGQYFRNQKGTNYRLIINPGTDKQKIVPAKVLLHNASSTKNFAVLKATEGGPFNALPFEPVKTISTGRRIYSFSFPYGSREVGKKFPKVVHSVGIISNVYSNSNKIYRFRIQGYPGYVGGPVLDQSGNVIGITSSNTSSTSGYAMAGEPIRKAVFEPVISFKVPKITEANRESPMDFAVNAFQPVPRSSKEPLEVSLIIQTFAKTRKFAMARDPDGKTYRVKATPVPLAVLEAPLQVTLKFEDGTIKGLTKNRTFKVGLNTVRLSDVVKMRLGDLTQATLESGGYVQGKLSSLSRMRVKVGGFSLNVDVSKAEEIEILAPQRKLTIDFTVVVRQGDKEVGRKKVGFGGDTLDTKGFIARGQSKTYNVFLRAGVTYQIDQMSSNFDCFLRLKDSTGRQLTANDDGGVGLNSRITYRPTKSGNYQIVAGSLGNSGTGNYTLKLVRKSGN